MAGHLDISTRVSDDVLAIVFTGRAIKGVPLVGAIAVQLDHQDLEITARVGVQWTGRDAGRRAGPRPVPGDTTKAGHIDIPTPVTGDAVAPILSGRALKGVPLIDAIGVQLDHYNIIAAPIGIQWTG